MKLLVIILPLVSVMVFAEEYVYSPGDSEQFIFPIRSEFLQNYGYDSFCKTTESFLCRLRLENRLDYQQYVGTRGYFTTDEPVHQSDGYNFWPVILEDGSKFFYVFKSDDQHGKYGIDAPIVPFDHMHQIAQSFIPEPLVSGSEILVKKVEVSYGNLRYILDNEKIIDAETLSYIRELTGWFSSNQGLIADALTEHDLWKDTIENHFFIQSRIPNNQDKVALYIGVRPDREWLRQQIKYYGNDWLFIHSYKVAVGDKRWESGQVTFERDHSSKVWEWLDKSPTEKDLIYMKALSKAENSTIRFYGEQYYHDFEIPADQREAVGKILALFDLLQVSR